MVTVPTSARAPLTVQLGPQGPFPETPLTHALERRWLHYAFLTRNHDMGLVANVSWLGASTPLETAVSQSAPPHSQAILLLYRRGVGWSASQFNAQTSVPLWSAFRRPHPYGEPRPLTLTAVAGTPFVQLQLQRSSRSCTSQAAPFARDQYMRWQSEPGILAQGDWCLAPGEVYQNVEALGYHERVRGYWRWPDMGGWVFGFANDPQVLNQGMAPPTAVVFTLIQPPAPATAPTGSVILWRSGRLRRHFPRRNITVAVRGTLDRDRVAQVPQLSHLLGVAPMAPIPRRLLITAGLGDDRVTIDFLCETAARLVVPSETSLHPYSVHEVIGQCQVDGQLNGESFHYEAGGIVEFAGGAHGD